MLCFLDFVATFVGGSGSDSRELCAGAGNSVSFRCSLKSSNHQGRSVNGSSEFFLSSFFYLGFGFLGIAPVSWMLVRHFALILNLMNLKQVAPVPWMPVRPLFSTSPVMAM